jgi:hypothetical protein
MDDFRTEVMFKCRTGHSLFCPGCVCSCLGAYHTDVVSLKLTQTKHDLLKCATCDSCVGVFDVQSKAAACLTAAASTAAHKDHAATIKGADAVTEVLQGIAYEEIILLVDDCKLQVSRFRAEKELDKSLGVFTPVSSAEELAASVTHLVDFVPCPRCGSREYDGVTDACQHSYCPCEDTKAFCAFCFGTHADGKGEYSECELYPTAGYIGDVDKLPASFVMKGYNIVRVLAQAESDCIRETLGMQTVKDALSRIQISVDFALPEPFLDFSRIRRCRFVRHTGGGGWDPVGFEPLEPEVLYVKDYMLQAIRNQFRDYRNRPKDDREIERLLKRSEESARLASKHADKTALARVDFEDRRARLGDFFVNTNPENVGKHIRDAQWMLMQWPNSARKFAVIDGIVGELAAAVSPDDVDSTVFDTLNAFMLNVHQAKSEFHAAIEKQVRIAQRNEKVQAVFSEVNQKKEELSAALHRMYEMRQLHGDETIQENHTMRALYPRPTHAQRLSVKLARLRKTHATAKLKLLGCAGTVAKPSDAVLSSASDPIAAAYRAYANAQQNLDKFARDEYPGGVLPDEDSDDDDRVVDRVTTVFDKMQKKEARRKMAADRKLRAQELKEAKEAVAALRIAVKVAAKDAQAKKAEIMREGTRVTKRPAASSRDVAESIEAAIKDVRLQLVGCIVPDQPSSASLMDDAAEFAIRNRKRQRLEYKLSVLQEKLDQAKK